MWTALAALGALGALGALPALPALPALVAPALLLPIGHSYATQLKIPLLGSQTVSLSVLNQTHARVCLRGLLCTEGLVVYTHTSASGFQFELDDELQSVVRRYGCSLSHADFDPVEDEARLTLHIRPLLLRTRLRLVRSKSEGCAARSSPLESSTLLGVSE